MEKIESGAVMDTAPENEDAAQKRAALDAALLGDLPGAHPVPGTDTGGADDAPPRMDAVESLTGLLGLIAPVFGGMGFRAVAAVWSPETCQQVAAVSVPVLKKYPWGARVLDFLETGAGVEEVAAALVLFPVVSATVAAIREDGERMAAKKARDVGEGEDVKGEGKSA